MPDDHILPPLHSVPLSGCDLIYSGINIKAAFFFKEVLSPQLLKQSLAKALDGASRNTRVGGEGHLLTILCGGMMIDWGGLSHLHCTAMNVSTYVYPWHSLPHHGGTHAAGEERALDRLLRHRGRGEGAGMEGRAL